MRRGFGDDDGENAAAPKWVGTKWSSRATPLDLLYRDSRKRSAHADGEPSAEQREPKQLRIERFAQREKWWRRASLKLELEIFEQMTTWWLDV